MRVSESNDHLRVKAIAGTHVVLMALDIGEAARAKPDGYTILYGTQGTMAANLSLRKSLSYDPLTKAHIRVVDFLSD